VVKPHQAGTAYSNFARTTD